MNTNPQAKRILCYGDSNTRGFDPATDSRYPPNMRWTGILQSKLGNSFEIIEEGLNGRTTDVDDPENEGRNGVVYLRPCIESHLPLDVVFLMLGTNDLKAVFNRSPENIAHGIQKLVQIIIDTCKEKGASTPLIFVISPTTVNESIGEAREKYTGAQEKSKQLGREYKKVATAAGCEFIDLALHVSPSKIDGYHLDPETHAKIVEILAEKINEIKF